MATYLVMSDGGNPFHKFYLAESVPQLETKLKEVRSIGRKVSGVFLIDVNESIQLGGKENDAEGE